MFFKNSHFSSHIGSPLYCGGVVTPCELHGRISSKAHSLETAHRLAAPLLQSRTNWCVYSFVLARFIYVFHIHITRGFVNTLVILRT